MKADVQLRGVIGTDVLVFYSHHRQLLTEAKPEAEEQFAEHWIQMLADESVLARTILVDGDVAGYVAHFVQLGRPAISYVLGRPFWGRSIATLAVRQFLPLIETRPLYARVACDNVASLRVLESNGFGITGTGRFFSAPHGREVDELVLTLS